jgi:hypothetical protein
MVGLDAERTVFAVTWSAFANVAIPHRARRKAMAVGRFVCSFAVRSEGLMLPPERELDAKLVYRTNEAREIEAEGLAEHLVHLRSRVLRPDGPAELPLDRAERGLHVRPAMVGRAELGLLVHEEPEHTAPRGTAFALGVALERM